MLACPRQRSEEDCLELRRTMRAPRSNCQLSLQPRKQAAVTVAWQVHDYQSLQFIRIVICGISCAIKTKMKLRDRSLVPPRNFFNARR